MSDKQDDAIGEVREWLVRIDTNQSHQTLLLEEIKAQSTNAFHKAGVAEDKADMAISKTELFHAELREYKQEQSNEKKWLIRTGVMLLGAGIPVLISLIPIIIKYYG